MNQLNKISYYKYEDKKELKGNIVGIKRKLPDHLVDRWKEILNVEGFTERVIKKALTFKLGMN